MTDKSYQEHRLKTDRIWFQRILDGTKTFEVRRDDRGFQKGDRVVLLEVDPDGFYSSRQATFEIGDIFRRGYGCDLGEFVVLSLLPSEARP